jgi:hypothetical protein
LLDTVPETVEAVSETTEAVPETTEAVPETTEAVPETIEVVSVPGVPASVPGVIVPVTPLANAVTANTLTAKINVSITTTNLLDLIFIFLISSQNAKYNHNNII